ncbi:sulfatase family protein [Pontiella sulfatireligans]|uniref:Arylsulfatase n=1 Tax=Pontiella sulfatireligans TaxID=2750658 RepID=A0A6C2UJP4_9BACT|nr:sulfatase [Pontiella sulfatireligans]SPS74372.1 sulfatase S1_8 [Kiritimatiellales bacterium]VGO19657.1 Arylsulfatase [Pontiella sulfatireligans]
MKPFIFALAAAGLVSLLHAAERPNFVFFLADDVSQEDIGCYGHPTMQTPHIDQLAADGLRFDNVYLTISSCSPSRCSMISGRYPHNTGAPELHLDLPEGTVLFPKLLKETGYYTVLSGKNHMGNWASTAFDKVSKGKGPGKEEDWVQILKDRPKDKPFFCWFASTDAHRGWTVNDDAPKYTPDQVVVPPYMVDGPKTREDLTGYYHEVSRFDHFIGLVTAELAAQGVLDNTVIIVTADNGRPFPRSKTRLYDNGIKPPFVVHYPNGAASGATDSFISSIDVAATALDLAGVAKDERIQGVSFASVLTDHKAVVRDVVFAEHNWHVFRSHERMVRFGDWLYIRNQLPDQQNLCAEAYAGGAGAELWEGHAAGTLTDAQKNVFWNPCPEEELYHVGKDPHQLVNVAGNPENKQVLERMRGLLGQWTDQTGDTLPENLSPSRDAVPGQPKKDRKAFKRGELPGAAAGADKINHSGPVRF